MIPYEQFGLSNIAKLSEEVREACQFSSLLTIQPMQPGADEPGHDIIIPTDTESDESAGPIQDFFSYPLLVQARLCDNAIELVIIFKSGVVIDFQAEALIHQLSHVICQLASSSDTLLNDFELSSEWDLKQAIEFNGCEPEIFGSCIHHLVETQASIHPDALAISGYDGDYSYSQLERAANRLAHLLVGKFSIGLGDFVHICFEKTTWFVVAILAVNKTGAAWSPLDPSHPSRRYSQVISQTAASLILTSPTTTSKCVPLVQYVLEVSSDLDKRLAAEGISDEQLAVPVSTTDIAYIMFTSGTTGMAKGVAIEHRSLCTSQMALARRVGFTNNVRMLQFAAFIFDMSISEIYVPLLCGGCVCMPSWDEQMNDISSYMSNAHITAAIVTPTVARSLKPEKLPSLEILILGGEAVASDIIQTWFGKLRLYNAWGPTESCAAASVHELESFNDSPMTIGRPITGRWWLVNPNDPQQLTPIGCIGEIALQGPTLLREYLGNPSKTRDALVTSLPDWAPRRELECWSRFYRTGDLGFYNPNGTIEFCGRKDSQVKLRGLRIELHEIEHQISTHLPGARQVAVDVINRQQTSHLVAYCCFNNDTLPSHLAVNYDNEDLFLPLSDRLIPQFHDLIIALADVLPSYMVPKIFIPCGYMPLGATAKLDRKLLIATTTLLSQEQLDEYSLVNNIKRAPVTNTEEMLQQLWADILKIPAESIGRDDSFFQLGGDSMAVIRLVSAAREVGLGLSAREIFSDARLHHVASKAQSLTKEDYDVKLIEPFSMLTQSHMEALFTDGSNLTTTVFDKALVEDAYPCSKFQEGLMALAAKSPSSYVARLHYRISRNAPLGDFKAAWEKIVQMFPNLRSRIVHKDGSSIQLILKDDLEWDSTDLISLDDYLKSLQHVKMGYGSRLCRYVLIEHEDGLHFIWTMHHAVFDGWTMKLILKALNDVYEGVHDVQLQPFSRFIQYTLDLDHQSASDYWSTQLQDAKRAIYPNRLSSVDQKSGTNNTGYIELEINIPKPIANITKATMLRAAWAVLLSYYCDTTDVCFGTTVSGRQAPVAGITEIPGPAVATVPVRVHLEPSQSVLCYLTNTQAQSSEMIAYEQFGLHNIIKLHDEAKDACDFSSLLVIQPRHIVSHGNETNQGLLIPQSHNAAEEALESYFTYPLVIQAHLHEDGDKLVFIYNKLSIIEQELVALSYQLKHIVTQLGSQPDVLLKDLTVTSDWDLEQSLKFNAEVPTIIDACVHELVELQARRNPSAHAICSWDQNLTYGRLNESANRLAHHLVKTYKVRPGGFVHVCFEKSAWHFVSILAINKAGAAWVPLDPSHPEKRLRQVISQTSSTLILTSAQNIDLCSKLAEVVLQVDAALDERLAREEDGDKGPTVAVTSNHAAYVLFTSGSTGQPKGLVMEHAAVCTSQTAIANRLNLSPEVRILQFAAFIFDLSIGEIIGPLISGACVCVPSDHTRLNNLEDFIYEMKIGWAYLTPSFVRTLDPSNMPDLKLLLLAGEAVPRDVLSTWFGKVRLINGWGPAETCCFSTLHEWSSVDESPLVIGRPVGGFCWIVSPENHQRLVPTGTLGEIVIQGPTILREYLADTSRTNMATTSSLPTWAPHPDAKHWNRFYKSGDLGYHNTDGTIVFNGRKDSQIKIRGLRVELEEVEHYIRTTLEGARQVAVDVYETDGARNLVAYVCFNTDMRSLSDESKVDPNGLFAAMTDELRMLLTIMLGELKVSLPQYMIPTLFIPCTFMPSITSTKLDRNMLRRLVASLSTEQKATYSLQNGPKRMPETDIEIQLQELWANLLNIPVESVGRDDNFLLIGGDSVLAIQLASRARKMGIYLEVKDLFDDPRLLAISSKATKTAYEAETQVVPFSLLSNKLKDAVFSDAVRKQCCLSDEQTIEDAYPSTSIQQGLIALSAKKLGSYVAKYVFRIPERIDISRLRAAWDRTADLCANLRSRIVIVDGVSVQLIIQGGSQWRSSKSRRTLASILDPSEKSKMTYGLPLSSATIVHENDTAYFIWEAHHSIYDGWTLQIIINTLHSAYHSQQTAPVRPYSSFVSYYLQLDTEKAAEFWTQELAGAKRAEFPSGKRDSLPGMTEVHHSRITLPEAFRISVTKATVVRAAWAVVLARYCDTDDVVFGTTVSGRQAPVPGVESIAGPLIATVPSRIRLDNPVPIAKFLNNVQSRASSTVPYEQFGVQNITKLSQDAKDACDFSSLLVIQPPTRNFAEEDEKAILLQSETEQEETERSMRSYFNYPLVNISSVGETEVYQRLFYDSAVLTELQVEALSRQIEHVMHQFLNRNGLLGDVSLLSSWDVQQAVNASQLCPATELCTHWLIQNQINSHPDEIAIASWDGNLTYSQVGTYAARLAAKLQELGVGPESLVPLCFSKSCWAVISMVAVQMAGGAFVPLDPNAPQARLQGILRDTGAALAIASPCHQTKLEALGIQVFTVDEAAVTTLPDIADIQSEVQPGNACVILFTSGSTGKPKGMVIQHNSICSSSSAYGASLNIGPGTRVFQYSAYTFDVGVLDCLVSLIRGACICIPSDHDRLNNLAGAINASKANWIFLTPTVANLLQPTDLPTLKTVCLGGEAISKYCADRWVNHASLHGLYGPAEASICAWNSVLGKSGSSTNLGHPLASAFWVVEVNNPRTLVPIGCVGELLIESPMLARGYLNVSAEIAANWMDAVDWLPGCNQPKRVYRTGDLVRRNADGTFDYVGRKDSQVKIHGQRVELGEIEARVQEFLPPTMVGIVDVLKDEKASSSLLAFIWCSAGTSSSPASLVDELSDEAQAVMTHLDTSLREVLPSYMIPSSYLLFDGVPEQTATGKTNRKSLISSALHLTLQERLRFAPNESLHVLPTLPMELKLRDLWAQILHISPVHIGKADSFLRLGGDSISAIQLSSLAQSHSLNLTVAVIFQNPRLEQMANAITEDAFVIVADLQSFSMLSADDATSVVSQAWNQCSLPQDTEIDDAYPCTKLQEGLMALSVKQPGSYIAKYLYRLPAHVNVPRFRAAWKQTMKLCSSLRTRIIHTSEGSSIQVVWSHELDWSPLPYDSLQSVLSYAREIQMTYGSSLCQVAFVEDEQRNAYFFWALHHTVFDGLSMQIVLNILHKIYLADDIPQITPYSRFIHHVLQMDVEETSSYWKSQLQDAEPSLFPSSRSASDRPGATCFLERSIGCINTEKLSVTVATVVRSAWAIVLGRYCDTHDVCFGTTISGRQASVPGIFEIVGPIIATIPVRIKLDDKQPVSDFLQSVQEAAIEMIPYEQFGLQSIMKLGEDAYNASLLVTAGETEGLSDSLANYFSYPLVVQAHLYEDDLKIAIAYDSEVLTDRQVQALSSHLGHVIHQLTSGDDLSLQSVSISSSFDLELATTYNSDVPDLIDSCIHKLIEKQAKTAPNAWAIQAWDGNLTYMQLDQAANRLANHLIHKYNIQVNELIHVCFEKSKWHFISILAINKAGAAWVPLDPSHPIQRLEKIVRQTRARVALCSPANSEICSSLVDSIVQITPEFDEQLLQLQDSQQGPITSVSPDNVTYVLFTSGSTGTPKGLVMRHRSVCTSQKAIAKRLGLTTEVRMLQFAAFVFDLSIGEIIAPLITGACICVPSEYSRINEIEKFVQDTRVTWAFLTPSFVRTLNPDNVSGLELLLLAGEAVPRDVLSTWFGKLRLVNGWGPAETCVFSSLHEWRSIDESPLTVGCPVGGFCWIVDAEDHNRLAPVGITGEIVIQGPTLLQEYLADPDRTNVAIVQAPEWMPLPNKTHWSKCYKSGDLGYFNLDGTIEFSARKDTQIKIHGIRIEATEVEFHIQQLLPDARQVAVDVFKNNKSSTLVAYFCANDKTKSPSSQSNVSETLFLPSDEALQNRLGALVGELSVVLPRYMIPTMFIPCKYMPFGTSTKLDRKLLHEQLSSLNRDQRAAFSLSNRIKRQPETEMEKRLQTIWAEILNVPMNSINKDDTFFQLGGDSIMAMYLVSTAKEDGIAFTAKDVFDDPRLSALASKATLIQDENADATESTPDPFSLLSDSRLRLVLGKKIRQECGLQEGQTIRDAYPCSPLQEGLIALATKQPGSYVATYVHRMSKSTDISRFKNAWDTVVEVCGNLRTRIVLLDGVATQIVLNNDSQWQSAENENLDSMAKSPRNSKMGYGTPLCWYAIVSEKGESYFLWCAHHSIYDGWTMKVMFSVLYRAYSGTCIPDIRPFSSFIKYAQEIDGDAAVSFWKTELSGAVRASFPPRPAGPHEAEGQCYRSSVSFTSSAKTSITQATILRAAWAIVLARYCDSNEAVFGVTVSGRQAPIPGADMISGAMIATVPLRVRLDKRTSISEFLHYVQKLSGNMIPYEQYGLQKISKISTYAKEVCDFSSLLVIQPPAVFATDGTGDALFTLDESTNDFTLDSMDGYFNYPLAIIASLSPNQFGLNIFYHSTVLTKGQVQALVSHLDQVVQTLFAIESSKDPLGSVSLLSPWDFQHAIESTRLSPSSERCVHWLIQDQILSRPDDIAIASSDIELTYSQVGILASRLAMKLQDRGVGPEIFVLLCLPKSVSAVISMISVLMAGGAFIALDPSAPATRLRGIIDDTHASIAIVSPTCANALDGLGVEILLIDETALSELPDPAHAIASSTVKPQNACVVLFTSGSTGRPKGMVIQHNNICSSSDAYGADLGIGPGTRVFQFSAYTFDVGILDCLVSLMRGACLCIPSDHARVNDLPGAIRSAKANWAFLTPTVADLLSPAEVPSLKVLCLGGEAISKKCADRWVDHVELHGLYGPAEASICAWNPAVGRSGRSTNLGRPLSSAFWVVEPSNYSQLVPVGCVGELLIEGPMLARGYLNVSDDVAANWMEEVDWLPGDKKRLYCTGDLVRRNADGTFEFMGRKDTQVKLHGQRLELGEIESLIQEFLPYNMAAVVDVAKADDGSSKDVLLAFLWYTEGEATLSQSFRLLENVSEQLQELISLLNSSIATSLPTYMIPSSYLIFEGKPELMTSGKVNRRSLVNYGRGISVKDRLRFTPDVCDNESPTTQTELQLRDLWAQVLDMDDSTAIRKHDSFLQLGGDSISAIHLVSLARRHDINLSVALIFSNPRLSSMAESIQLSSSVQADESVARFSLIPVDDRSDAQEAVMVQCKLSDPAEIDDIYTCTDVQQNLMALTIAQPGSYISKHIYRLDSNIDIDRFKVAWEQTVLRFTNLRTRLVFSGSTTVQAVIKEPVAWSHNYADLCSFTLSQENASMAYGSRLCEYAIISQSCDTFFALNIHHAIFDWQTFQMVIKTLQAIYTQSTPPSLVPYTNFIQYVMDLDRDAARKYWSTQLSGARRTAFPMRIASHKPQASKKASSMTSKLIHFPQSASSSTTLIRAAWSIILAQYERADDVCFGTTVSGRQAPVEGIDEMPGSVQASVPIRVRLDKQQTISNFLQDLQTQALEMAVHEQYGLPSISRISASAKDACRFTNFLVIQPDMSAQDASSLPVLHSAVVEDLKDGEPLGDGFNYMYPLVVQCQLHKDNMQLALIYTSDFLHSAQADALLEQFDYVLGQLRNAEGEARLSTISVTSPWEVEQAIHATKDDLQPIESRLNGEFSLQEVHRCWVVAPDNHHKLAPIGCVGELVLQGHALGDTSKKAAEMFIDHFDWLPDAQASEKHKFYKTGDLVRYNADRSIDYIGRKEAQVEIRGQQVQPYEIEAQIKLLTPQVKEVSVDVMITDSDKSLIAFVAFEDKTIAIEAAAVQLVSPNDKMQQHLSHLGRDLAAALPIHMVPKYIIPVKYMPLNGCGKIDKAALLHTAMKLSTGTLGRYLASQHPPFRDCSSSLEQWILAHWAIVLGIPAETIGADDNFFQLGGDSIQAISILRLAKDNFGVPIEQSFSGNHTTVSNMAKLIETALEDETTVPCFPTSGIDLLAKINSICRASWISHPHALQANPITTIRDQSTIFLTGATGFLGTEILKQLVRNPAVRSVVAHVRSKSVPDGMRRIQETAKIAGWWREEDADKLEIWLGDLSEARLGLNEAQWKRLSGLSESESSINAIVHNGASVNWHATYDTLCHPNVNSTVDLLMVAATSPTQPKFVFVSGGAFTNPDDHRAIPAVFLRDTTAYIQTKFVCEEVIKKITRNLPSSQNRVSIVKPGRIIGASASGGVANTDDFIWRVVATASSLRAYPEEPEAHWNFIQDVSSVASGILNQIFDSAITPFLISGSGMPIPVFWHLVNSELETPCKPVPWSEWLERATAELEEVGGKHPLWTVQKFLRQLGVPQNALNYKGVEYIEYKEAQAAVKSNVRYLRSIGFISSENGFGNTEQENVIRRVHAVRKSA
ncbi:hypothetical protein TGAMA5MH_08417 [Trichoderma gamsii]|uniref:Carrier domain-containing protein n=1 Tax=Trichoderma gamsii TaxID=398673 RepID=A0A2K0T244_9HYPO|nr:hypothetical protein TGAMA5MH_08417 [Trichoderma gamsii]